EIGDMPLPLQAKLLRFLEERCFRRVGGTKEIEVDVRIIAATNQDLEAKMESNEFRKDLFYRLNVIPIEISPLRERPEDVADLALLFANQYATEFRKSVTGIDDDMIKALEGNSWPGNVRELRNVIERAMILTNGPTLSATDFPRAITGQPGAMPKNNAELVLGPAGINFESFERDLILRALEISKGNQSAAARLLQMSRDQIRYRMDKFGLHETH
ncbi:MAG: two-component system response regulator AtoC, partial [Planctomycetota bacterium]